MQVTKPLGSAGRTALQAKEGVIVAGQKIHFKTGIGVRVFYVIFMLVLVFGIAHGEEVPQYTAETDTTFFLRMEPATEAYHIMKVPEGSKVKVITWGDEWSKILYSNQVGYGKTEWLYCFRSLDAMKYPHPEQATPVDGYWTFNQDVFLAAGDFKGLTAKTGQVACVGQTDHETYTLPVWRDSLTLTQSQGTYSPFVAWSDAQPGDVIGGFTTFYGDQQGKGRAEEREHNILLGSERIHLTVVEPDAIFSFNDLCAPYKKRNGYQLAPNISQDGTGYGGGICQLTTTLYNAILTLPMQIEEWEIHRYSGIAYAPQFFDAAVGSYSDLRFRNTLPYPIQLQVFTQDGMLTVFLVRAEVGG